MLDEFEYSIKTIGFFHIKNCIKSPDLLKALKTDTDQAIEKDKSIIDSYDSYRFNCIVHQLLGRGDSFLELLIDPQINQCAEKILSPSCTVHSYNAVKLLPNKGNNASKIHRDSPRFYNQSYPLSLQALVCIDPFTLDNGATHILPGSHHHPERPSDGYFYKNSHRVVAEPGDVIFFDSMLWHAGGENKTNSPRRGITIVYNRSFMKPQIDFTKALPDSMIDTMPDLAKKLIGMNVRVPSSLQEFYLPTEQRLYRANQG